MDQARKGLFMVPQQPVMKFAHSSGNREWRIRVKVNVRHILNRLSKPVSHHILDCEERLEARILYTYLGPSRRL